MHVRWIVLTSVVAALSVPSAAAADPGATREDPVVAPVGTTVTAPLPAGGDAFFRVTTDHSATYSASTQGSDVATRLEATIYDGSFTIGTEASSPDAAEVLGGSLGAGTGLLRVHSLQADRDGTAHLVVRDGPAPEDDASAPVELDLSPAGPALATASRAGATDALQPGEPGGAGERASVWFAFTAPASGPIALDACLPAATTVPADAGRLRILADDAAAPATGAVLAEGGTSRDRCEPATVEAVAGTRYRVQVTTSEAGTRYEQAVVLRARLADSPPTVTTRDLVCEPGVGCSEAIDALPAPGATVASLDCRVGTGPSAPCPVVDGHPRTPTIGFGSTPTVEVRATDDAGRTATTRTSIGVTLPKGPPPIVSPGIEVLTPLPLQVDPRTPPAVTTRGAPPPAVAALPTPTGRFSVTRRGTRVRSLAVRGLPAGARVSASCRGAGCPRGTTTRTAARAGALSLRTPALARATLRRGATLTVRVSATGRATRTARWIVRARRAPVRVLLG